MTPDVNMVADAPAELDLPTLARAQRGDRRACRALVERYQRPVFALVGRMLGRDDPRVEDLAQETFLRVFRALPRFEPAGSARLSTWILTIATRVTLDARRRRRPILTVVPDTADARTPDRAVAGRQTVAAIERGLAALPDHQRAPLVLRVFHELSYAEIAAALQVDVGTIKSRIGRGRQALRTALEDVR